MRFEKIHNFIYSSDPDIVGGLTASPLAQTQQVLANHQLSFKQHTSGFFLYSPQNNDRLDAQPVLDFALFANSPHWADNFYQSPPTARALQEGFAEPARLGSSLYYGSSIDEAAGAPSITLNEYPLLLKGWLTQSDEFSLLGTATTLTAQPVTENSFGLDASLSSEDFYQKDPASTPPAPALLPNAMFLASQSLLTHPPLAIVKIKLNASLATDITLEFNFSA